MVTDVSWSANFFTSCESAYARANESAPPETATTTR